MGEEHWNDTNCMHLYLHSNAIVFQKLLKIQTSILLQEQTHRRAGTAWKMSLQAIATEPAVVQYLKNHPVRIEPAEP